ncbi:MAG: acyl-CoA dehydrogenase family protein, partial [Thermodesulfobacteriota bacterium]
GFFVVLCRTEPDAPSASGLSLLLVEADRAGLSWESAGPKLGMRMLPVGNLQMSDVRVPFSHLIGKPGRGLAQVQEYRHELSVLTAGMFLGVAHGAFSRALDHTKSRVQFGRKIAAFEITRHKLADMALRIQAARLVTYQAAWGFDRGRFSPMEAAMARACAAEAAVAVSDEALQLMGGYGYMAEYEVEHFYRDAKVLALFGGGWEKNAIADALIGRLK